MNASSHMRNTILDMFIELNSNKLLNHVLFPLHREAMGKVLARGHSRVPVYSGNPKNIIGLLLVSFA